MFGWAKDFTRKRAAAASPNWQPAELAVKETMNAVLEKTLYLH